MMKRTKMYCLLLLGLFAFTIACSSGGNDSADNQEESEDAYNLEKNSEKDNKDEAPNDLQGALDQVKDAMNQLQDNNGEKVEVADFRKLKELLPERIGNMKKVSSGGEKTGMMGFSVSQAEAKYEGDDSKMEVSIVDVGGVSMALTTMAAWSVLEVDRESDEEIERTTTIDGHKAFEQYYFKSKSGETNLLVNKRFVVKIKGENVDRDDFTRAVKRLELNKLERI